MHHYSPFDDIIEMEKVEYCDKKIEKLSKMATVPHVDMDVILAGKEKRLTIEESQMKGVELCKAFMKELLGK
ncbi:MAG: hypothetical protein Q4E99_01090 [Bacillota bacterium]|nr:hypothetical protein [Bacillota bacterium]